MLRPLLPANRVTPSAMSAIASNHASVVASIQAATEAHEWVIVGMRVNPLVKRARKHLTARGLQHHYIEHGSYFSGWKLRLAIKLWSGWPTFPQVFHKGILVGGATDLEAYLK